MPRSSIIINTFNAGELSPKMFGRTDFAKYPNGCAVLENFVVFPHGGATKRPGTYYVAEVKDSDKTVRLVGFEFSTVQAYILEFGDQYIRFFKDQGQILDSGSPYEIASPYLEADLFELKFAQSADVLYIVHRDYAPRKLSRTAHTAWTLSEVSFVPPATYEQDVSPAMTLTLSAVSGSGVTFTAGSAYFLAGDIDRQIISGAGRAVITNVSGSGAQTTCTGDVLDAFASVGPIASGSWSLRGSPNNEITSDKKEPKNAIATLTSTGTAELKTDRISQSDLNDWWTVSGSGTDEYYYNQTITTQPDRVYIDGELAVEGELGTLGIKQWAWGDNDTLGDDTIYVRLADGTDPDTKSPDTDYIQSAEVMTTPDLFRSADVGKYVRIHDGLVKLTVFTSSTSVKGQILTPLSAVTATTTWTLESAAWNATDGYPEAVCFYGGRLFFARDDTLWGSMVQDYENFTVSSEDDASVEVTLLANEVNTIQWLEHGRMLIAGAVGGEWTVDSASTSDPITPTSIKATRATTHGCANVEPLKIGSAVLFLQRAGRKIREHIYKYDEDAYVAPDMTLLAEHISESGIVDMAYQQEPYSIVWAVRTDGTLIGLTYDRQQDVVGWHRHLTDGLVESVAVIPGTDEDEIWLSVERTINGSTKRYIEYLKPFDWGDDQEDCFYVDCGLTYDGAAATTISGLDHLEGETLSVLADGTMHADCTVASGQITLTRSASVVHAGLPYTAKLQTMPIEAGSAMGTAQGKKKRLHEIRARFYQSLGGEMGGTEAKLDTIFYRKSGDSMDGPPPLYTGDKIISNPQGWNTDGQVMIVQEAPLPMTVLAVMAEVSVSDE